MFRSFKIQCASQYNIVKLHDLTILCNKVQLWASLEWFCTFVSIRKTIEICNHFATKIARNLTVQNNRVVEMGLTKEPSLSMTTSSVRNCVKIFLATKNNFRSNHEEELYRKIRIVGIFVAYFISYQSKKYMLRRVKTLNSIL